MADRDVELGASLDEPDADDELEDVDPADEPVSAEELDVVSVPDEPDVADVVAVVDPELDDGLASEVDGAACVAAGAAVAPGICRATTRPTTPVRAAADRTTDVVTRRTRVRAPSRRRRSEALRPRGSAGDGGDSGGWE